MSSPLLLSELRRALEILYSLGAHGAASPPQHTHEAHAFLLKLQSRNLRRKLYSLRQKQRDQSRLLDFSGNAETIGTTGLTDEFPGSTWLACLALLCHPDAHSAERLFAAQTLLHRVRRVKLSECIDLEMEDPRAIVIGRVHFSLEQLAVQYSGWMNEFHPLLGRLIDTWLHEQGHSLLLTDDREDDFKGSLTMLTISAIAYLSAASSTYTVDDHNAKPLVYTLGSVMAVMALRLRYTPKSVSLCTHGAANSTPLVQMVTQSLSLVAHQSQIHGGDEETRQKQALHCCLCVCIATIPDTILGSPGGARGRLSIDPRCVQAARDELHSPSTGVNLLWEAMQLIQLETESSHGHVLTACERWAKFLALPLDFIRHTMPMARHYLSDTATSASSTKAAWSYLVSVFDAATWSTDRILSFSLGLSADQLVQQTSKKRQSSRSKKRQKEVVQSNTTVSRTASVDIERWQRGEAAMLATELVWPALKNATMASLKISHPMEGADGPIVCVCACANACLPHALRHPVSALSQDMLSSLADLFQRICSYPRRTVRALTYEPMFKLHDTLLLMSERRRESRGPSQTSPMLESLVVNHLVQCSMGLAASCGYPIRYFEDLGIESDQELEIERNDVRDVLRTVAGSEGSALSPDDYRHFVLPVIVSSQILNRLVNRCAEDIATRDSNTGLPPETAVHAFSALAKPVGQFAVDFVKNSSSLDAFGSTISRAFYTLGDVCSCLVEMVPKLSWGVVLPVSRLAGIATASFAPVLSVIALDPDRCGVRRDDFQKFLESIVHAAALSLVYIPELASESSNDHNMYGRIGAMRGPGGEDHVGCLALMRLCFESEALTLAVASVGCSPGPSLTFQLCKLHGDLKSIEADRGPGVVHGVGVTPKSRRILLSTICRLVEFERKKGLPDRGTNCSVAASSLLSLFDSSISCISAMILPGRQELDEATLFVLSEAVFDLASFSTSMLSQLFASDGKRLSFVEGLIEFGRTGYRRWSLQSKTQPIHVQWSRFLASLFLLARASATTDIPLLLSVGLVAWTEAECDAIRSQCDKGPHSTSAIFNESVLSECHVPPGLFVRVVCEVLDVADDGGPPRDIARSCVVTVLKECRIPVCQVLLHPCPEPSFDDPRPTLCEAWFQAMASLSVSFKESEDALPDIDTTIQTLLSESCGAAILLLLHAPLVASQDEPMGMSLDGPQSRGLVDFFENFFLLGGKALRSAGIVIHRRTLDVMIDTSQLGWSSESDQGVAIIGAVLLRAVSGALPPWAVEDIPRIFSAFFYACGSDPNTFGELLRVSMEVRLSSSLVQRGPLRPGESISGPFIQNMKQVAKSDFVALSKELSSVNNMEAWKRFKVLLKQVCGGKKKGSGFSMKPTCTIWDAERV